MISLSLPQDLLQLLGTRWWGRWCW